MEFQETGVYVLGDKSSNKIKIIGGFDETSTLLSKKTANSGGQELTLNYLCENSKNLMISLEKSSNSYKGKENLISGNRDEEKINMWIERDFLQLDQKRENSWKRGAENEENVGENREKKLKVESLNLTLALPDVSAESNPIQNQDLSLRPSKSVQSLRPSDNNTFSNDLTAASLSYPQSHHFSHNPSCSLLAEYFEYSGASHLRECDQILNCGEGTNGSVHSRFRPIGDGTVSLSNHGWSVCKDSTNSLYRTSSSDNNSFLPSELLTWPRMDAPSGHLRYGGSENLKDLQNPDGGRLLNASRPERILREIVSESISVMAKIIQDLTDETLESTKEYLKNLIAIPEKKYDLESLQNRLEWRTDLTNEVLAKCLKSQLEILVAIRTGLGSFLSNKNHLTTAELVDIYLLERCRNINCKRLLPVEDCDCKICSTKKGFCSECMCPVCLNFDTANNTCSWVGCDVCSHWCHAACGLQRNLIKPGPSLKGPSGTTEMQFHCPGCDHTSEMLGFVKDVFMSCAKNWGLEILIKELDCVRKIFRGSEDCKGKELRMKAGEMLTKVENNMMTPSEVCNSIFQFFSDTDNGLEFGASSNPSKVSTNQECLGENASALPLSTSLAPKPSFFNRCSSGGRKAFMPVDFHQRDNIVEDEWSVKPAKKDRFDSLENLVRIKEAEARMFQSRADEAQREAESFRRMVRMKTEKLEEEYAGKLTTLCLEESEERQKKKLEELKLLENSHCDYYNLKIRMQSEIAGLLKSMELTKQQVV